jgi:hypothetical protein
VSTVWQTVHVRVNDAATGQPTPVRIRFSTPEGEYLAPFGRLTRFATETGVDVGGNVLIGDKAHAYIDGACEIRLPAGPLRVEISKGPEYRPHEADFTLPPGKLALRFEVKRWIDLRSEGWYSGDTRTHFLTPHAALLEAMAEDVAVVNLLAEECLLWGERGSQVPAITNILAFSGQRPALEGPGHLVAVNTMNRHRALGRLLLLNCHRVVFPLTFFGPGDFDDWSLADWCDQCHRKGGLVIGDGFFPNYPGRSYDELLADLILGKVDALQLDGFENPEIDEQFRQESEFKDWCKLLDCGLRVPVVGGSGKDFNLAVIGHPRTYARLLPDQEFNYKNWIEAVRAGRTFVTNGPLVFLTVNGQDPGSVIDLPSEEIPVRVRAEIRSPVPFRRLEVVGNNRVVGRAEAAGEAALFEGDVSLPGGGWLAARCWGEWEVMEQWVGAQTSPVYVQVNGRPPPPAPAAVAEITSHLDRMQDWVRHSARCEKEHQRRHLADIFQSARDSLLRSAAGEGPRGK